MGIVKLPCNIQDVFGSFAQQQVGQADAQVLGSQLGPSWNVTSSDAYQLWVILRAIFMLYAGRRWELVRTNEIICTLVYYPLTLQLWYLGRDMDGSLHGVLYAI